MNEDFKKAEDVEKYLEGKYREVNKKNIEDYMKCARAIAADHSLEELTMIKKRIDASISLHKDTSYTANPLFSIMLILITVALTISTKFIENKNNAIITIIVATAIVATGIFLHCKSIKSFLSKMYRLAVLIDEAIDIKEKYDKARK